MLSFYLIKFIINFIYKLILYFFKSFKKRYSVLLVRARKFSLKQYFLDVIGYNDNLSLFIVKFIFLYPIAKLILNITYLILYLLFEFYLSLLDGLFALLLDVVFFFEKFDFVNRSKLLVYIKIKSFNLLNRLHNLFSLKFLKVNLRDFYLDYFFISLLDSFFLIFSQNNRYVL